MDFLNLSKKQLDHYVFYRFSITDKYGFEYKIFKDSHLCLSSEFAKNNGLYNFYAIDFIPKIKRTGSIAFLVPKDENEEFSLTIEWTIFSDC
jgi:hypothetical protein